MICNILPLILTICIICLIVLIVYKEIKKTKEGLDDPDPMLQTLKEKLKTIHPAVEKLQFKKGDKSYTINKEEVYLCLKDENGNYYNENMLMYVALHELAHAICDEIGHTQKFHNIFQGLLDKAYYMGLYNPSIPIIQNYCNYSPEMD
jgi:hypothetical protein